MLLIMLVTVGVCILKTSYDNTVTTYYESADVRPLSYWKKITI